MFLIIQGLAAGDALLSVNGERFDTVVQFGDLCREHAQLELEYVRLGEIPVDDRYVKGVKRAIVKRVTRQVEEEATAVAAIGAFFFFFVAVACV